MRIGDLVSISDFPAVVVLSDVAALKEHLQAQSPPAPDTQAHLRVYLEHYFIDEPENRAACEGILSSLARIAGPGAAFVVRGVYGSGKSHLLAIISLLAECPDAWPHFLAGHPEFRRVARCFSPERRLVVVQVSLDEFSGQTQALEDVVFAAAQRELSRPRYGLSPPLSEPSHAVEVAAKFLLPRYREELDALASASGMPWAELSEANAHLAASLAQQLCREKGIPIVFRRSRAEALALLSEAMAAAGLAGLVILLDELSLFLAGKNKRDLDTDASFLQFLAQRAARQPIWIVASTQRPLEDLGDIDAHTLRQIGDRFSSHSLSLAQLRAVLDRKVVQKRSPAFRPAVSQLHSSLAESGGLSFSQDDLLRLYPLNPLAMDCLEELADSFLSKTRSLLQFVQAQWPAAAEKSHGRLLCCDDIFDFFWPRMQQLPEARPHASAFAFLEEHVRKMGLEDPALAEALTKGLVLCGMAGLRWSVREHADALAGSRCCEGARPDCAQVQRVLEALHRRGAYVEVSRQPEQFADIYFLDVATDASELVRRRLDEILATLEPEDGRVLECAYSACAGDEFPLATLVSVKALPVHHGNVRRRAQVRLTDLRGLGKEGLRNAATALESPQSEEDACVWIATLWGVGQQKEAWRQAAAGMQGRFAAGLLAWLPSPPGQHDITILREYAAFCLMLEDAAFRQGRKGREVQAAAASRRQALQQEVRALLVRLYAGGEILEAGPGPPRLAPSLDEGWEAALSSALRPAFDSLFPDATSIAPGRALSSRLHVNQIIGQFLRPQQPVVLPGSSIEAHVRDFLAPMGLAERKEGRWMLSSSEAPVVRAVMALIPDRAEIAFADLAGALRKSTFGLTGEQTELAVAAMARTGWLTPLDAFLTPLKFEAMGLPLPDHAPFWRRTRLMPPDRERAALELARALFDWKIERLDPPTQQRLWERAQSWAETSRDALPRCRQELDSLVQALGQEKMQWADAYRALGEAAALLSRFPFGASAAEGLEALLEICDQMEGGVSALLRFEAVKVFARDNATQVARIYRYVSHSRLRTMPGSLLERQRARLLESLGQPDGLIENAGQLVRSGCDFIRSYCREYAAWHAQAHSPAHFKPYLESRESDWYAALAALKKAGMDQSGALAAVDALLQQALAKHCAGAGLRAALDEVPTCPHCGLALGERPELAPPGEIEQRAKDGMRAALSLLRGETLRRRIEPRLADAPAHVSDNVRRLLDMPENAGPADVALCCTAEVAEWLRKHTAEPGAVRSLEALAESLKGKRLSKAELVRLFTQWLDAQATLADDDYVDVQ